MDCCQHNTVLICVWDTLVYILWLRFWKWAKARLLGLKHLFLFCCRSPSLHDNLSLHMQLDLVYVLFVCTLSFNVLPFPSRYLWYIKRHSFVWSVGWDSFPWFSILAHPFNHYWHLLCPFHILLPRDLATVPIHERTDNARRTWWEGCAGRSRSQESEGCNGSNEVAAVGSSGTVGSRLSQFLDRNQEPQKSKWIQNTTECLVKQSGYDWDSGHSDSK